MVNEENNFLKYKDQIIDNLEQLRINLENCEDMGMLDMDDVIYNEIFDLIEEAAAVETLTELSEIVLKAKTVETKVENWYAKEGITNIELTWPQI